MPRLRGEQGRGAAYRQEPSSLRGLSRTFGITRKTITRWLKKLLSLPAVEETLSVARASDVIEFDEA